MISPDERVELIDGIICKMGPEGARHVAAIDLAVNLFNSRLKGLHGIRIQHPLRVASHAEPEPDVAIVEEPDPRAYLDGHPTSALLVIEVADNSLEKAANTQVWNMTGQPAMSIPLHWTPTGLPLGVQFAGAFGAEEQLFSLAGQIERVQPWLPRLTTPMTRVPAIPQA